MSEQNRMAKDVLLGMTQYHLVPCVMSEAPEAYVTDRLAPAPTGRRTAHLWTYI